MAHLSDVTQLNTDIRHLTENRRFAVIGFGHAVALCYSREVHNYMPSKGGELGANPGQQ